MQYYSILLDHSYSTMQDYHIATDYAGRDEQH